jgi:hypothetical protein
MHRVIAHLDTDAFFASIEQLDNAALRGMPVIARASPTQRGVVCCHSSRPVLGRFKLSVGSARLLGWASFDLNRRA